ncbi:DgyrCDS12785 [Dimorphilus gyrociliatus]|uniref:DgyrCDS12785 n=1 Tax=Dimorphilus gyrociliatus TaxID=2664684 RepID=A0A7I8W8Q2_9ANNE|nr:DgyrCDS12785 [Dimorphilus gyrociliatus]
MRRERKPELFRWKRSLIKKLFSWRRKVVERKQDDYVFEETSDKDVEYATFSAQFPPPEWELEHLQRFIRQNGNSCPIHLRKSKTLPMPVREENVYEDVIVEENQNQGVFATDISIKYNGKFLKKNNPLSRSKENGVNCVEFDKDAERRASIRRQKRKEEKLRREESVDPDPLYYQCSNSSGYHSQQTSFSVQSPDAKKEKVKEAEETVMKREENGNRMTSSSSWSSYSSISKQTVKENPDYLEKQHRLANERLKRDARNRFSNDFQVVGVV